jgi:hypothetical protein
LTNRRTSATGRAFQCGAFTLVGPLADAEGRFSYIRHRCKSYSCPVCGPKKLRRARWRIAQEAQQRRLTRLASLTLDPRRIPQGHSAIAYLRETWRKMRVSLKRYVGQSIEFIAVVELHKSGIPHLHVLVGAYLPQEWLSDAWQGGRWRENRRYSLAGRAPRFCLSLQVPHERNSHGLTLRGPTLQLLERNRAVDQEAQGVGLVALQMVSRRPEGLCEVRVR